MKTNSRRLAERSLAITLLTSALLFGLTASQALAQGDANTLSQEIAEKKISFSAVNPYTQASGTMTITFGGVFQATKLVETTGSDISHITGLQTGTFDFVPDDTSQPTISGRFRFRFAGTPQPRTGKLHFAFRMKGKTPDGSVFSFIQNELVAVTEEGFDISFGETKSLVALNAN